MSRQMERMPRILVIRAIQQQNIRNRHKHKIVEHLCSKAGTAGSAYRHHEIDKVLAEELRDLMRPEEL